MSSAVYPLERMVRLNFRGLIMTDAVDAYEQGYDCGLFEVKIKWRLLQRIAEYYQFPFMARRED